MAQKDPKTETDHRAGELRLVVGEKALEKLAAFTTAPRRRSGTRLTLELVLALLGVLLGAVGLGALIF